MRFSIFFAFLTILTLTFTISLPQSAEATSPSFDRWLEKFEKDAKKQGISPKTLKNAFVDTKPIDRVIELDRKQPEGSLTFSQYRKKIVNARRVKKGREMMEKHAGVLNSVHQKYGVAPQYVVALWGIETNFGSNTGGFKVIDALATLAWEGRRASFFRKELINALKIIDAGHITAKAMKGSWAGAMGQNQFMPSSFLTYAVDGNGDQRRDIWGTHKDVFASSANYLASNKWKGDERWGRQVRLTKSISEKLVSTKIKKPMSYWAKKGIKTLSHGELPIPSGEFTASLVAPDGLEGDVFLVYNNFHTLMRWNRSTYFATSVGLLADSIAG